MADPKAVFLNGTDGQRTSLEMIWAELYNALVPPTGEPSTWGCALGGHEEHAPVVGRLYRNGTPACVRHIATSADRPGGWPLKRIEIRRSDR